MADHMLQEIQEQPDVLQRILDTEWEAVLAAASVLRERDVRYVVVAARGTSDNAAVYAKYLFEVLLGMPVSPASPSVFTLYESEMKLRNALVIGISQSGESTDVLEPVRRAGNTAAGTLAITNDETSSMAQAAEFHFCLRAGEEKSVAATKTYTAQLLLLYLLALALGGAEELDEPIKRLPDQARRVLRTGWEGTARYRYADHLVVVSRGFNLATAKEAALKLMETSYVVAEGFSGADLSHGPIAMIGQDFPVVFIVPPGKVYRDIKALVEELGDRGAELVIISEDKDLASRAAAKFLIDGSGPEELSPILYVLPMQLLARELSLLKGLNPDAPRGLSKVTETW